MENLELSDDLFANGRLHLEMNHFLGHHHAGGLVADTVNNAAVAGPEFGQLFKVVAAPKLAHLVLLLDKVLESLALLVVDVRNGHLAQLLGHVRDDGRLLGDRAGVDELHAQRVGARVQVVAGVVGRRWGHEFAAPGGVPVGRGPRQHVRVLVRGQDEGQWWRLLVSFRAHDGGLL